jgi:Protein of unknown function (DUF2934)
MHDQDRFRLIQERAYEIYRHRDPNSATAEDDWRTAEAEIEWEESQRLVHRGPARFKEKSRWAELGTPVGHDIENPA